MTSEADLVDLAESLARGETNSADLVGKALARYQSTESAIHAFAWLDEERDFLLGKEQLEKDIKDWQKSDARQKKDALLSGLKLNRARAWLANKAHLLSEDERLKRSRRNFDRMYRRFHGRARLLAGTA